MKKTVFVSLIAFVCFASPVFAQTSVKTSIEIVKAEDELRYDKTLADLLINADANIRTRAALAAGRIGDEKALPALTILLESDSPAEVRAMAAFAIGEIESIKGADAILKSLRNAHTPDSVRARAAEAAGKIAAANAKDEKSKELGKAILEVLEFEDRRGRQQNREVILLSITAALRAKPEKTDFIVAKFLTNTDARVRADAANTLARLRAKNANASFRAMLSSERDAAARANAVRALGAAEDKDSFNILLKTAIEDEDSRVRVSAIRALGNLKDAKAANNLWERGEKLLADYKKSKFANPNEKSEMLEIATTLGKILLSTNDEKAIKFLENLREADRFRSPETEIAFAQIAPRIYLDSASFSRPQEIGFGLGFLSVAGAVYYTNKYAEGLSSFAQGLSAIADNKTVDQEILDSAREKIGLLNAGMSAAIVFLNPEAQLEISENTLKEISVADRLKLKEGIQKFDGPKRNLVNNFPDVLRAFAKLKSENYEYEIAKFLINKRVIIFNDKDGKRVAATFFEETVTEKKEAPYLLLNRDPIVRATAAELMGEMTNVNSIPALYAAYDFAVAEDKEINDAQLAILDAAVKQNKVAAQKILSKALDSPDYLVRRHAANLIKQNDLTKDFPNVDEKVGTVKLYNPQTGTKLGQVLNTNADYVRAVSRKNGSVKAVLTTEKGDFTIDLTPEDAPLTVDNFVKLAKSGYFDGLAVHRVVPNFVMQDGDPRGDGNGGPGWQIRCEVNMLPYERGAVGMALSGKDTGGSQWFATHSPQPHLDGSYTVFGRVNETGMKIVDSIVRGDKILSVKIVEGELPSKRRK